MVGVEATWSTSSVGVLFDRVLTDRTVGVAFQPIVALDSRQVVGYEALARGPAGTALESPAALLREAARQGRTEELDWVCQAAAVKAFMTASLPRSVALFVNVEPASLGSRCPADLVPIFADAARRGQRIVVELTERSVTEDPAGLLRAVDRARQRSVAVALDDVGANPASLAMMPLIQPDVIKLDLRLIQRGATPAVTQVVNAVLAEAERTGATVVAEGVESEHHVSVARAMGAVLGQGWLFGVPGQLPGHAPAPQRPIEPVADAVAQVRTPFELVAGRQLSSAPASLLLPMSRHLEHQVLATADPTVLLACFQDSARFTTAARRRFERLAVQATFTAVLGRGMPAEPGRGIRGARLGQDDPIVDEWSVIVVGPHFAGALLAKQQRNPSASDRVFDFYVTHNRDMVIAAALSVLARVLAEDELDT